jgi:hypothetical protein
MVMLFITLSFITCEVHAVKEKYITINGIDFDMVGVSKHPLPTGVSYNTREIIVGEDVCKQDEFSLVLIKLSVISEAITMLGGSLSLLVLSSLILVGVLENVWLVALWVVMASFIIIMGRLWFYRKDVLAILDCGQFASIYAIHKAYLQDNYKYPWLVDPEFMYIANVIEKNK